MHLISLLLLVIILVLFFLLLLLFLQHFLFLLLLKIPALLLFLLLLLFRLSFVWVKLDLPGLEATLVKYKDVSSILKFVLIFSSSSNYNSDLKFK